MGEDICKGQHRQKVDLECISSVSALSSPARSVSHTFSSERQHHHSSPLSAHGFTFWKKSNWRNRKRTSITSHHLDPLLPISPSSSPLTHWTLCAPSWGQMFSLCARLHLLSLTHDHHFGSPLLHSHFPQACWVFPVTVQTLFFSS